MAFLRHLFRRARVWDGPNQAVATAPTPSTENRPGSSNDQLHTSAAAALLTPETSSKLSDPLQRFPRDGHQAGRHVETRGRSGERGDDLRATCDSAAFLDDEDDLQTSSDIESESLLRTDVPYSSDHPTPTPSEQQEGLPLYSDVSVRVVVNPDGRPRFLTPQEKKERQASLQRAVQERMLGLSRQTNFSWAPMASPTRPEDEPLPLYAAERDGGRIMRCE
jgi:hypothetical protein